MIGFAGLRNSDIVPVVSGDTGPSHAYSKAYLATSLAATSTRWHREWGRVTVAPVLSRTGHAQSADNEN
jgi:hypothetical protein